MDLMRKHNFLAASDIRNQLTRYNDKLVLNGRFQKLSSVRLQKLLLSIGKVNGNESTIQGGNLTYAVLFMVDEIINLHNNHRIIVNLTSNK